MVSEEATPARYNRVLPQIEYIVKADLVISRLTLRSRPLVRFGLPAIIYMNVIPSFLIRWYLKLSKADLLSIITQSASMIGPATMTA
jgi:hypothetical protein